MLRWDSCQILAVNDAVKCLYVFKNTTNVYDNYAKQFSSPIIERFPESEGCIFINIYIYILYMGVDQTSFFQERTFLAKKDVTLAKLSPCPQKPFARPYVGLYGAIFCQKTGVWQGRSERRSNQDNSFCGGCTFTCGVLLFTMVLAHLLRPVLTLPHRN